MADRRCVYDCRHPLWGGDGICLDQDEDPSRCSCVAGWASQDALGQASCVPIRVLRTGYLVLAAASFLTLVLLIHHLGEYRHLPQASRCLQKTVTRLRVLLSGSFYVIGVGIVGVALAVRGGRTNLNDAGVVQVLYVALLPAAMFCSSLTAEFWVSSLPVQFLPVDSVAGKLRNVSDEHHIFTLIGCLNAGGISSLGVMSIFVPYWPQLIADGVTTFGIVIAMATIFFVAVQLTRCITQASLKGGASGNAFYVKARRNVWRQALAMCGVCVYIVVIILMKRLTTVGGGTPIIFWTLQALSCHMACWLFALATKFEQPVALLRRSSTLRSSTLRPTVSRLSSRRRSSLIATVSPVAQQLLKKVTSSAWQSVERGGHPYQVDPISKGHAEEPKRRGSVQWAETKEEEKARRTPLTAKAAKVLPIENGEYVGSSAEDFRGFQAVEGKVGAEASICPE